MQNGPISPTKSTGNIRLTAVFDFMDHMLHDTTRVESKHTETVQKAKSACHSLGGLIWLYFVEIGNWQFGLALDAKEFFIAYRLSMTPNA